MAAAGVGRRDLGRNIALLFGAFAAGQGSLFLAQTWLLSRGDLALLGRFGTSYLLMTLAYYVVDWGGMVVLARRELVAKSREESAAFFWDFSAMRAAVAALTCAVLAGWAVLDPGTFETSYVLAAAPGVLLGALNFGGVIDGLHRSGLSGVAAALPMVASAAMLPFAASLPPGEAGAMLGAAFTLGTLAGTLFQLAVLKRLGRIPRWRRPSLAGGRAAGHEGGLVLLTLLPSYTFYRGQVAISALLLGPAATGLFVYAKQIVNGIVICNQFIRRAEFPRLVETVSAGAGVAATLAVQKLALAFAAAFAAALLAGGVAVWMWRSDELGAAALLIACFAPTLIASGLYSAMHQAYLASGRSAMAATVAIGSVVGGLLLCLGLALWIGLVGFAAAEALTNAVACAALLLAWRSEPAGAAARLSPEEQDAIIVREA